MRPGDPQRRREGLIGFAMLRLSAFLLVFWPLLWAAGLIDDATLAVAWVLTIGYLLLHWVLFALWCWVLGNPLRR